MPSTRTSPSATPAKGVATRVADRALDTASRAAVALGAASLFGAVVALQLGRAGGSTTTIASALFGLGCGLMCLTGVGYGAAAVVSLVRARTRRDEEGVTAPSSQPGRNAVRLHYYRKRARKPPSFKRGRNGPSPGRRRISHPMAVSPTLV
jgi:hypothetical protein